MKTLCTNHTFLMKVFLILSISFYTGCEKDKSAITSPEILESVFAPTNDLSIDEIFEIQGILNLHFSLYHCSDISGKPHYSVSKYYEVYFTANKMRLDQFLPGDESPWITTVYDLEHNTNWQYNHSLNTLSYQNLPNLTLAFENNVINYLTSKLSHNPNFRGYKDIEDKKCSIIQDNNNDFEWVWLKYRLPIQWEKTFSYSGITQTTTTRMRDIQVNIEFSDSLFIPPED